jgi:hypothetical protein
MAKKTRAQKRNEWERRIWTALVEYANTGDEFKTLVSAGLDWIGGDISDLEQCKDMKGQTLDSLAVRYREEVRMVLAWLSAPDSALAPKACHFLMQHGSAIRMSWTEADYSKDSMLISEWPDEIGSVISPVCKFTKEQIDRHDLGGEPLRNVIPIGMCDRCGKFRVMKLNRATKHFFCSDSCKVKFHQANKSLEQKAKYMRGYRKTVDRNKPKTGGLVVRRKRKTMGGK